MAAIAIYQDRAAVAGQSFSTGLFKDFIAWIDRGERTTQTYITNLRQFAAWLKYAAVTAPERQDIILYRDWLESEHDSIRLAPGTAAGWIYRTTRAGERVRIQCKASTVKAYLQSVRQFFKWTASEGLYPDVAANVHPPKIRQDIHKKDAFTVQDIQAIEASITEGAQTRQQDAEAADKDRAGRIQRTTEQGKRLYAMYLLAVNAGLRTVELHRANVKDLEVKSGQAWLYIWGKGHAEPDQKKPIAREVLEALQDYLRSRTDGPTKTSPLFVSTGNRSGGKRIATTTISTMLKKAMIEAGFNSERLTPHSLRHTTGTAVQELTGDLYKTQLYMRHSSPATTEIYLHTDTEKQEVGIAQDLYNLFHAGQADKKEALAAMITKLDPGQLDRLAGMAAAMMG